MRKPKIDLYCAMCGAEPGQPCRVVSGTGEEGDRPGDVRPDFHWARGSETRPGVLIPDEPDIEMEK